MAKRPPPDKPDPWDGKPKPPVDRSSVPRRPGRNGGTLLIGNPGNRGGHGTTPSELRKRCRDALSLKDHFDVPINIIRDPKASHKEKLRAWAMLAKYGGLASVSLTDADGNALELPQIQLITAEGDG